MRQPKNGDIWTLNGKEYLITRIRPDACTLWGYSVNLIKDEDAIRDICDGTLKVHNDTYHLANFAKDWQYNRNLNVDGSTAVICPECSKSCHIPEGDFICEECRGKVFDDFRVIAQQDSDSALDIVMVRLSKEELHLNGLIFKRDEFPTKFVEALQRFLQ